MNPQKWMLTSVDCALMWVKNGAAVKDVMGVDREYLKETGGGEAEDFRVNLSEVLWYLYEKLLKQNWGISFCRRFRSLKLWFVIRSYGVDGLREHIRNHCRMAKRFEELVRKDGRFKVCNDVKVTKPFSYSTFVDKLKPLSSWVWSASDLPATTT